MPIKTFLRETSDHVGPAVGVMTSITGTTFSLMLTNDVLPIVQLIALTVSIMAGVVSIIWYAKQIRASNKKSKSSRS